jgi:hypothetical protein
MSGVGKQQQGTKSIRRREVLNRVHGAYSWGPVACQRQPCSELGERGAKQGGFVWVGAV